MEVYWSIEDADMQAPQKQIRPNVKRLNGITKESSNNIPVKEKMKSVDHERKGQIEAEKTKCENTSEVKDAPKRLVTLKDLCAEDKQRVANLIKELARVDGEKEVALTQLAQQKASYEDQARTLAAEREKMRFEREVVEAQLRESQKLLEKYQKTLKEQQERKIIENLAERVRTKKTFRNFQTNPVTEVNQPMLRQSPTDIKYNHLAGNNGEDFPGAGNQIIAVSSTHPHLVKTERGTGIFSQAAPTMCSRSTRNNPIEYKSTSDVSDPVISRSDSRISRMLCPLNRPDLSSTRYSEEEFFPGSSSSERRTGGVPSIFSGTGTNQSSEKLGVPVRPPEHGNQRDWDTIHNSDHSDNAVGSSRYDAVGVNQVFGRFENAEVEGNRKILSAESLDDERERLREVLQSQREFLKKQEQELRLLFDAQRLSSTGLDLGPCSNNGRVLVGQRPDVSALRPKPSLNEAHTVNDGMLTERVPKSVNVGTSPLKLDTLKEASSEAEVSTNCINEPSIPSNVTHRMESQKQPTLRNETKSDAQFSRKKKHQTGKSTVHFFDDSVASRGPTGRHGNGRHGNGLERSVDENCSSDSSLEESKIIDELFFGKRPQRYKLNK